MTLPTSGNLGLLQARAEFGKGVGSLSELRRAPNGVVPDSSANTGVPQSLPLRLSQLRGAQNYTPVTLDVHNAWIGPIMARRPPQREYVDVDARPAGGNGNYTFTWTKMSGSAGTTLRNGGNPATFMALGTIVFPGMFVAEFSTSIDTWRCTVSDGVSSAYKDFTISVEIEVPTSSG